MGWSCSYKAMQTLEKIFNELEKRKLKILANGWKYKNNEYFLQLGKENKNGAITGVIYKIIDHKGLCKKVGNFKIDSDGKIIRFPYLPKEIKKLFN